MRKIIRRRNVGVRLSQFGEVVDGGGIKEKQNEKKGGEIEGRGKRNRKRELIGEGGL